MLSAENPPATSYSLVTKQAVTRGLFTKWQETVVVVRLWQWFSGSLRCHR